MGAAEIDRSDAAGIGDQIGEDVASTRRDRHHVALRRERERLEVDLGVFPDLGVDQSLERPGEHDFEQAFAREGAIAAHRLVQAMAGRGFGCGLQAELHVNGRIDSGLGTSADVSLMTGSWPFCGGAARARQNG